MKNTIRLLIAEDHNLVREGIIKLLEDAPGIVIVGEAENGADLYDKYFHHHPDIVLSDIEMPKKTGLEVLNEILRKDPSAKFIFLSVYSDDGYLYYTIRAGAYGLLSKSIQKSELLFAINSVNDGRKYFMGKSDEEIKNITNNYLQHELKEEQSVSELTKRELDVLLLVADGMISVQIADKLNIGKRTVDTHRMNIMKKLNLKSFSDLVSFAVKFKYGHL